MEPFEKRVRDSFARQVVMSTIGARIDTIEAGRVVLALPFRKDLTQQHGFLHAGIVTTVLDSACGYAAFSQMPQDAEVLTVEFKSNFIAPAQGALFRFEGQVLKAGRTLSVVEGKAYGDGKLVSSMMATMMTIQSRPDVTG